MNSKLLGYYAKKLVSWEGWIENAGKKHKLTVNDLKIDLAGRLSGQGTDFVGKYVIQGAAGPRLLDICQETFEQEVFLKNDSSTTSKLSKSSLLQNISGWTGDRVYFRKIYDEARAIEYSGQMIANQLKGSWSLHGNSSQKGQFCIYMTAKEWTLDMYPAGASIEHPAAVSIINFASADEHGLVSIGCDRESGIYIQLGLFEVLQKDFSMCKQYVGTENVNFFSGKFTSANHQYHARGSVQYPNFAISHFEFKGYKIKEEYYPQDDNLAEAQTEEEINKATSNSSRNQSSSDRMKIPINRTKTQNEGVKHIEVRVPHSSSMDSQMNRESSQNSSAARSIAQGTDRIRPDMERFAKEDNQPQQHPHSQKNTGDQHSAQRFQAGPYNATQDRRSSAEIQSEINGFQSRPPKKALSSKAQSDRAPEYPVAPIYQSLLVFDSAAKQGQARTGGRLDEDEDLPVGVSLKKSGYLSSTADWELFTDYELSYPEPNTGSPDEDIVLIKRMARTASASNKRLNPRQATTFIKNLHSRDSVPYFLKHLAFCFVDFDVHALMGLLGVLGPPSLIPAALEQMRGVLQGLSALDKDKLLHLFHDDAYALKKVRRVLDSLPPKGFDG